MIASDNAITTGATVPTLPFDLTDQSSYDGAHVTERFGYTADGMSAANLLNTGLPWDTGSAVPATAATVDSVVGDVAPAWEQGGNDVDGAYGRMAGIPGVYTSAPVGLNHGFYNGAPQGAQLANGHGITLARAGAPTDDGRPATVVVRDGSAWPTWCQLDGGMGVKNDSAPPLASVGVINDVFITNAMPSPGGSLPAMPNPDPVQVNTYRVPPTPWDEYNYIGGPLDG